MSAKAIREALEQLRLNGGSSAQAYLPDALAEIEAIEKAAGVIDADVVSYDTSGDEAASERCSAAFNLMARIAGEAPCRSLCGALVP